MIIGNFDGGSPAIARHPGLLSGDGNAFLDRGGIVRANFRADAVLERRNDFSARGVIFRVRRENQQHVERHAHRVALNLNVAFLHDVEQADLNFSGEVGQVRSRRKCRDWRGAAGRSES